LILELRGPAVKGKRGKQALLNCPSNCKKKGPQKRRKEGSPISVFTILCSPTEKRKSRGKEKKEREEKGGGGERSRKNP